MPEGPEVRTIARVLAQTLVGKSILAITLESKARHRNVDLLPLPSLIARIWSYGKKLLWRLSTGYILVTSLGMEGRWMWTKGEHSFVEIEYGEMCDGIGIIAGTAYFDDSRRFGKLELLREEELPAFLARLGPDPLAEDISTEKWAEITAHKPNWKVGKFLLDQSLIAGVGNYLRAEILYRAGISPHRRMSTLTAKESTALLVALHERIRAAYGAGGMTIKSYWDPNGEKGRYIAEIYGQTACSHGPVIAEKLEGRTIYWCPSAQC